LNRAIDFARGEGLVEYITGNRIQITFQGVKVANRLLEQDDLLVEERTFLEDLGKSELTEKVVNNIFSEGR
jgi:hypothetical protein